MSPLSKPVRPDEPEIEGLLSRFKPQPSQRFYRKMKEAPWHNPLPGRDSPFSAKRWRVQRLVWRLAVFVVLLLAGSAVFIPQVRAIARQIIFSFIAAPSNQIKVQVTPSSPGDLFDYSDPASYPLSLDEAQVQAGFQLKQISPLPPELKLLGARYEASYNAVIVLYQGDNFLIFLTQRPLGNSQDVFSVGKGAAIEMVKIGELPGEYVRGGWKAFTTQPTAKNPTPESPVNITAVWDNSLPQSTLRWQANNMAYELRSLGEGSPSQSELILWANELK